MSLLLLFSGGVTPTLYYVIGPSSGWSDPSVAEIKAGQLAGGGAATAAGDEDAPTGSTTYDFAPATGLTAGTAYRVAFVWSDGTNDSNVAVSSPFSTTATFLAAWARNSNMIVQPGVYA
jgi:hypothetical protein